MSKRPPYTLYIGKSGQMAVMAEFLARGYNVAIPEVDVGDDIFVVRDESGELSRIQVKTANAREVKRGFKAQFSVSMTQLETPRRPDLYYVLAVRRNGWWKEFVSIDRDGLHTQHVNNKVGSFNKGKVVFNFLFSDAEVLCSKQSFQKHRNSWQNWPELNDSKTSPHP